MIGFSLITIFYTIKYLRVFSIRPLVSLALEITTLIHFSVAFSPTLVIQNCRGLWKKALGRDDVQDDEVRFDESKIRLEQSHSFRFQLQ